jgi:3-keto-disaccharide hydrolase
LEAGWTSLFDGKTLDGWSVHGGFASYKVEDGTIVGTTVEGSPNTFLCKGDYKDFVLEVEVQCDPRLNSGVQVRSHVYDQDGPDPLDSKKHRTKGVVYGPQCEIARQESGTAGRFYDESRRDRWICEIVTAGSARSGPRPGTRSRTRDGTATRSSFRAIVTAPGSTAFPVPTSPTTSISTG